ncbi:UNVERIFIED_CONTAM: hypothetical protein PYX00_007745 [Menopon gallinae]|uniref:Uncharacterized protein n=1 Tax=Menopon gallinae TaxID=328185 RepID=A0AAW2HKG6_9NEOP
MISNHSVARHPTPKPIFINEDIIGSDLWKTLIAMDFDYDPVTSKYTVTSPVVAKNGFKVDLEKSGDIFVSGYITEVASMIPFYGIAELKETLRLYHSKGEFADLGSLRTTAVTNYITNEAVRIVQQNPRPPDLKDIKEWIDTWQTCLKHLPPQCLHCNDIFVPIYHIKEDFLQP